VTGVKLQKLLFFLSAMTIISLASMETATMLAGASALMLYAIGLIGAQKRDIRYLWTYGFVSILIIVLTCIGGLVLVGMMAMNPPADHDSHQKNFMMSHGMATLQPRTFTHTLTADVAASTQHGVYTAFDASKVTATRNGKIHPELAVLAPHKRDVQPDQECDFQITGFGWGMIALGSILALLMFVIKIKTIVLAFRMRRMLVAIAGQRLPVTMSTVPTGASAAAAAICNASKPVMAQVPAETRPQCERCTFVNVAGPSRCAMCDSPLPLAAAPVHVNGAPKIYVAGTYVPMNQI